MRLRRFSWLILLIVLSACSRASTAAVATTSPPPSPTLAPSATASLTPTHTATPPPSATPSPSPVPSPTASPTPKAWCGAPAEMTILVAGAYRGLDDLADAIRIVRIDFVTPKVTVVPLPRDLEIQLPPDVPYNSPTKLNVSYILGTPVFSHNVGIEGGAQLLARTIEHNFGIHVDHYLVVSGRGFRDFIDVIGGVPVYIPYRIKDYASGANFYPGPHWLDGREALQLARARKDTPGGDLTRIERQTWILKGILISLAQGETLQQIPDIFQTFQRSMVTDLTLEDVKDFTCLTAHMLETDQKPIYYNPPTDLLTNTRDNVYIFINQPPAWSAVVQWDERYVDWLHKALQGEIEP